MTSPLRTAPRRDHHLLVPATALALLLAACNSPANPADAPLPTFAAPSATPSASATSTPTPDPTEALLEELRATDAFVEFAEADRAMHAPGADFSWNNFVSFQVDETNTVIARGEFANKVELWNETVRPIRDGLLLAGQPYEQPAFGVDGRYPANAAPFLDPDKLVEDVFIFEAVYTSSDGRPVLRIAPVALTIDPTGITATVRARMEPMDLSEHEYPTRELIVEKVNAVVEEWVDGLAPVEGAK